MRTPSPECKTFTVPVKRPQRQSLKHKFSLEITAAALGQGATIQTADISADTEKKLTANTRGRVLQTTKPDPLMWPDEGVEGELLHYI